MKLVNLLVARNEAWCLNQTLRAQLKWCDHVVILVHASYDDTGEIARTVQQENPKRVTVLYRDNELWNELEYRSALLEAGRAVGGTHFAVLDADEALSMQTQICIRNMAQGLPTGSMLRTKWFTCWRSPHQYRTDDSPFGRATVSMMFADAPHLRYEPHPDGYQWHMRVPPMCHTGAQYNIDGVLHMQHVVWDRLLAKQALYQMTEVLRWPSRRPRSEIRAQYSKAVDETGLITSPVPDSWWPFDPDQLDLKAIAWQQIEVKRLLGIHGKSMFYDLDLFGLDR